MHIHQIKLPTMYSSHSILFHQPLHDCSKQPGRLVFGSTTFVWIKLSYEHFELHRVEDTVAIVTWVAYEKLLIMVQTIFSN